MFHDLVRLNNHWVS